KYYKTNRIRKHLNKSFQSIVVT
ncbi:hypothetical protein CP8484711_0390, partial [Chlamydia psittaci 84-8471/1]